MRSPPFRGKASRVSRAWKFCKWLQDVCVGMMLSGTKVIRVPSSQFGELSINWVYLSLRGERFTCRCYFERALVLVPKRPEGEEPQQPGRAMFQQMYFCVKLNRAAAPLAFSQETPGMRGISYPFHSPLYRDTHRRESDGDGCLSVSHLYYRWRLSGTITQGGHVRSNTSCLPEY